VANVIFNGFKQYVMDGTIDLVNDTIRCALFTNSYTPDAEAHDNWGDLSGEASGGGYTSGGQALSGKAVTHDDVMDKGIFDADDAEWPGATLVNVRWAVLYKDAALPADRKLVGVWDLGADHSPTNVKFRVQWNATGILTLS